MLVPAEVERYGPQQEQGAGKKGVLRLVLDGATGRTVVREQYSEVPLFAQKAMYLEEALPSMAYMYVISPSGGVLQGDSYRLDVALEKNAQAHLTTQGATRIYRMEKGYATQEVSLSAGRGCYLEYMPDQIIPFAGSRLYQKTSLHVHEGATVVYSEVVTPGRVAGGEKFQYDICYLRIEAQDGNGALLFTDAAVLEPKKRDIRARGMLESDVFASIYVLTPSKHVAGLVRQVNAAMGARKVYGGASALPRNSGFVVRMLGSSAGELAAAAYGVAAMTRNAVLGAPFGRMRKG